MNLTGECNSKVSISGMNSQLLSKCACPCRPNFYKSIASVKGIILFNSKISQLKG